MPKHSETSFSPPPAGATLYHNNLAYVQYDFDTKPVERRIPTEESPPAPSDREQWGNKCDFFLSALGYAVGLGNVWRFPYLAYKHGGGSFLIPYSFMLLFAGLPLFFMELVLGQYSGLGPTRLFGRMAPAFKGLGFAMVCVTFFVGIYYNVIIAWTLHYTFAGFTSELPWSSCNNTWNTDLCSDNSNSTVRVNGSVSATEEYFNRRVLGLDPEVHTWSNLGDLQWELVLCLLGAWTIVCLSLIKGVQSSGKVVYFTALFPFVVLVILFITGLTLPGAVDGILFYIKPDFQRLQDSQVWADAATQIFYSLGPSFGGLITLASYNKFDNNCHRDAVLIAFSNCATSVFAGFVVFSILGFMAHTNNVEIKHVVNNGAGLAFVTYPDAITKLPFPPLWSFLFFFMLITLGLDSMFTLTETLTTAVMDHFRGLRRHKHWVVIATCVLGFVCGLSMVTQGGIYMFTLIDGLCASWNILFFAFLEVVLVSWLYGTDRIFKNIEEMNMRLSTPVKMYWFFCWKFTTPLILMALIVFTFVQFKPIPTTALGYYTTFPFPPEIQALGWIISCFSVVFLPLLAVRQVIRRRRKGQPLGLAMFRPTQHWGPAVKIGESKENILDELRLEPQPIELIDNEFVVRY